MVAVTRRRRYGPSRLCVNDDVDDASGIISSTALRDAQARRAYCLLVFTHFNYVFSDYSDFCQTNYFYVFLTHLHTRSSAIAEEPRDASCQLKSCQLPRNNAETTYTRSPDQTDGMKLEILSEAMRDRQSALNHDAIESAPIVSGVINKPTTLELYISPVYRRLAVAKFSKTTM